MSSSKKPGKELCGRYLSVLNKREGERATGENMYRLQSWVENTNMTECTQEIGRPSIHPTKCKLEAMMFFISALTS
jgi:hypothetical protein